mgnify:CR=1 FL=1
MAPKIHLSISADKGSVADALRELAAYIEEWDSDKSTEYPTQYESNICVAEITEETDLRESFAALIRTKGNGSRLDAEDLVDLNWTFVGDDGDCWTLPLTELVIDNKQKDVVFVFENAVARFEENLNDMENDMLDAVVEAFDEWL